MNNLCIFSGGLGTRLRGTESMPKPLLRVGSSALITLVVRDFAKLRFFDSFTILTCLDGAPYKCLVSEDLSELPISILVEPVRSGRLGAVKYFFDHSCHNHSYFCNADTLFRSLSSFRSASDIYQLTEQPVVYLADPDVSRNDYKSIMVPGYPVPYQNSGLFAMHKGWFLANYDACMGTDIDDLLLSFRSLGHILLNTSIIDVGTPKRLHDLRGMYG